MRVTIHWRGKALVAVDLVATSPGEPDASFDPPMGLSGAPGGVAERAEPMDPDTSVFGFGNRPESAL